MGSRWLQSDGEQHFKPGARVSRMLARGRRQSTKGGLCPSFPPLAITGILIGWVALRLAESRGVGRCFALEGGDILCVSLHETIPESRVRCWFCPSAVLGDGVDA
jgi:hypothetical protein